MKGKTGSNKMRGGGIATKGTGAALKGGGLARKGVGAALKGGGGIGKALRQLSPIAMAVKGEYPKMGLLGAAYDAYKDSKDDGVKQGQSPEQVKATLGLKRGGKVKKMADGGVPTPGTMARALPPRLGGSPNPPSDTPVGRPKTSGPMVRPGFPSRGPYRAVDPVRPPGRPVLGQNTGGQPIGIFGQPNRGNTPKPPGTPSLAQIAAGMNAVGSIGTGVPNPNGPNPRGLLKKNGGKVAKYAKGGAVKMTAGAGSGLGRIEKVAAHKAAPRVKAENLKNGGKVKGKK